MNSEKGFAPLIIIVIATLVIGAGIGGFLLFPEKKIPPSEKTAEQEVSSENVERPVEPAPSPTSPPPVQATTPPTAPAPQLQSPKSITKVTPEVGLRCRSNTKPVFTTSFTDLSKVNYLTPIGNINAGSLSRSYVHLKTGVDGSKMSVPIYAPTDATLLGIVYAYRGDKLKGGRAEYRLDFRVSCEVTFWFDHIAQISDRLKQFAPVTPADNTRRDIEISVPVKEGELLGYTNGGLAAGAWDFVLFNSTKEVPHINPSRWTSEHNKYADCPYDYFTEDLRKQYYSLFASAGGTKQDNPTCRSASRDVAGTLSGGWFLGSSTDMQGSRLLVGSDFGDFVDLVIDRENQPRFSVRDFKGKNPEDVKAGDTVCYLDADRNIHTFLKLLDETRMAAATGSGGCPSELPSDYEMWIR